MRTTIAIPDELFQQARPFVEKRSFGQFVREAIRSYVEKLEQEALAREMAEGYRAEAGSSSLDAEWAAVETDGWS
jgi:metal-responsive CopG/Arc/MetJ family transcriptional regulator